MADTTSLTLLIAIPCILLVAFFALQRNTRLMLGSVLFSALILFAAGSVFSAGQASQGIFIDLFLLFLIVLPVYLIYVIYATLKENTEMVHRALRR
jgi:hypothetical protein